VRRAAPAALALLALTLTGCETSAQKSAELERAAKRQQTSFTHQHGLSITRPSARVRVVAAVVLHSSEGDAVVLTLRNSSATSLRNAPIAITVADTRGASVYENDAPGLSATLTSAPLLLAHSTTVWIDDQIDPTGTPAKVSAKIGEGSPATGTAIPKLHVETSSPSEGAVEGDVVNNSPVTQRELVVNALARRNGKIVAAGRALVAQAAGGGSRTHFQLYLIGDPASARLEVSTSPTTLG
jgi:hypothetical protein